MFYVYILQCSDNTYYTGWTNNPEKRLAKHNMGKGSKYTKSRLPAVMVYCELLPDESAARKRECAVKKLSRKKKTELLTGGQNILKQETSYQSNS